MVVLDDPDRDGKAGAPKVFAEGFNAAEDGPAIGLLADDKGKIYLANIPHVWTLEDSDGDLVADKREKLISGFGVKTSLSGHDLHGFAWGPHDGKLYFSMGDRGFNITTKAGKVLKDTNSGAVFRCDPDGSNLEIFFHNLRPRSRREIRHSRAWPCRWSRLSRCWIPCCPWALPLKMCVNPMVLDQLSGSDGSERRLWSDKVCPVPSGATGHWPSSSNVTSSIRI